MFERIYLKNQKSLIVLGAGCSDVSQTTARVLNHMKIVQLSYTSASPALSDKKIYGTFFRVFPPESAFNAAKLAMLKQYGWKKIATLTETKELFSIVIYASIFL